MFFAQRFICNATNNVHKLNNANHLIRTNIQWAFKI